MTRFTPGVLVLVAVLLTAPGDLASMAFAGPDNPPPWAPIERFVELGPGLYRGAQPNEAGFRFLRDLGIQTVVSFRNDTSERAIVESLGMRFVSIPVTFRAFGWGDDFDYTDVQKFLAVVDDPSAGPIFFHCKRGADRTGSFAAIYRIARQGWDEKRALDEARDRGMRWWYFPMRGMVRDFAQRSTPTAAGQ